MISIILIKNNIKPEDETLEDSWLDIANFGLIGLMLERGKWKEETKEQDKERQDKE